VASLLAACVVHSLRGDDGAVGITAIDKRAAMGAVRVRALGLFADVQANRAHHGGLDKAVYAYGQEDADYWEGELGRAVPPGWFGENFRVEGIDVSGARVGDRWTIGDSSHHPVVVEVTMPRQPCQTFARWVGGRDARGWVKRFTVAGRPGAYLRVISTGKVRAGDRIITTLGAGSPTIADILAGNRA